MMDSRKHEGGSEPVRQGQTAARKTGWVVNGLIWLGVLFGEMLCGCVGLCLCVMWCVFIVKGTAYCLNQPVGWLFLGEGECGGTAYLIFLFSTMVFGAVPAVIGFFGSLKACWLLGREIVLKRTGSSRRRTVPFVVRTWTTKDGQTWKACWNRTGESSSDVIRLLRNGEVIEMDVENLSEPDRQFLQQAWQTGLKFREVSLTTAQKVKRILVRCLSWGVNFYCVALGGLLGFSVGMFFSYLLIGIFFCEDLIFSNHFLAICEVLFPIVGYLISLAGGIKAGEILGRKCAQWLTGLNPDTESAEPSPERVWMTTDGEMLKACWVRTGETNPSVIHLRGNDDEFEVDFESLSERSQLYIQRGMERHKALLAAKQRRFKRLLGGLALCALGVFCCVVVACFAELRGFAHQREALQEEVRKFAVPQDTPAGTRQTLTVDGVEYAFRWCPPGTFQMGYPDCEIGSDRQHEVTLTKGFWMLETEVTQAMWHSTMDTYLSVVHSSSLPMEEDLLWSVCQRFCRRLSQKTGLKITLPTEAQWEYACRAGTTGPYMGCDLDEIGWYSGNSDGDVHPVAQKKPNAWGLHDMLGNVSEWCQDWAGNYPRDHVTDPTGAPPNELGHIIRGSDWKSQAIFCRADYRTCESLSNDRVQSFRIAVQSE